MSNTSRFGALVASARQRRQSRRGDREFQSALDTASPSMRAELIAAASRQGYRNWA